jgi:dihydropteroate synthase
MVQDTVFCEKIEQIFNNNASPFVMGILNVTPDSFFDGGQYTEEAHWLAHAQQMIQEGVDIIDVGAYSTRPGATEITEAEELKRLIEVIESLRKNFPSVLISADTFRANVAQKAVEAGANIINDISGGTMDETMFSIIARLQVPYVLMHIQGTPQTMQQAPQYDNVVENVYDFFQHKLQELKKLGVTKVILDPGFGFGKTVEHNYQLLKHLGKFKALNYPLLVGFSRKSMVNKLLNTKPKAALNGTTILNTIALENGARVVRVHDVKEAKEIVTITQYIKSI